MCISVSALITTAITCSIIGAGTAAPVVNKGGVLNAASYAADGMPDSGIAQGSLFVVFGADLGASGLHVSSYPLPLALQGTSMRVTVKGATTRPLIVYTSPEQVAAILPSSTSTGDGTLVLTYNGADSAPVPIRVEASRFGLFTRNSAGTGPAVVQLANSAGGIYLNSHTDSAHAGQTAVLWGTGLGAVTGNEANIPAVGDLKTDIDVLVGNKHARVMYRGGSGCCAGVDQVIFEVPPDVEGCFVPLVVRAGAAYSNFTSMSIASNGNICSDATGFSASDLQGVAQGRDFVPGSVELFRATITLKFGSDVQGSATQDVGAAGFYRYSPDAGFAAHGMLGVVVRGASGLAPLGSCNVYPFKAGSQELFPDPIQPRILNAGDALNIAGPLGTKQMKRVEAGVYNGQLGGGDALGFAGESGSPEPPFLEPGLYTVDNGRGGSDVGPFRASIIVPKPVNWSNADELTVIDRSKGLKLIWTGGNAATEFVVISGISFKSSSDSGRIFVCTEKADAGAFTVPSHVLASLPAAESLEEFSGLLWIGNISLLQQNKFTAPGLTAGYLFYALLQFQNAVFQ